MGLFRNNEPIIQLEYNMIRISAGSRRWTSWLFTSLVKDFNSGLPWANPVSGQGRTWNLAPPDYMSSTLTPWPPDFFTLKSGWGGGGMIPFRGLVSLKWLLLTLEPSRVSSVGAACKVSPNCRASDISRGRGPAKFGYFREIPRNSRKNAKSARNISKYMSAKHI